MWLFKKKMAVDYLASVLAEAIEEDIEVFKSAIREHAAENVTKKQIEKLVPEFWMIELSVIDIVLSNAKLGSSAAALKELVPMLVVGYSPLSKEKYLARAEYYAEKIAIGSPSNIAVSIGEAFFLDSLIEYKNERSGVNPQALVWAVGTVTAGSLQALGSLINNVLKDYRVF